ncbi:hypothetical protein BDR06DRAFT_102232 [Suillus hirtellus]|nr:hypothetical protein BDR06DRAFT_102232 [Suillus hirtellus]
MSVEQAVEGLLFTSAANRIQTGIATIIVLEYSAFLPDKSEGTELQSAVSYYLKSPTAVAVEKGAKEILVTATTERNWERRFLSSSLKIACRRT